MSLRDRFRKGGGGFLNNVDGLIIDYRFTTEPDFGTDAPARQRKDEESTPLWVELTVRQDGQEKTESTHLYAGAADDFVISEDGKTLSPASDDAMLWGGTAFLQFYGSLCDNAPEKFDPDVEAGDDLNFEHIIGARVRFVQVKDEDAMKRAAKKAAQSKGKINAQGQKKGKDGKYYDIRTLQVSEVYSLNNEVDAPAPVKGKSARPTQGQVKGSTKTTSPSKSAKGDGDIAEFAEVTLLELIGASKSKSLKKSELNLAVTRKLVNGDEEQREAVRIFLTTEANLKALAESGSISYDKGVITAA